jgi:hypothetical protein
MIYVTSIGLTTGDSSTVHINTQTVHRTTKSTQTIHRTTQLTNWEEYRLHPGIYLKTEEKEQRTPVGVNFNFIQVFRKIHKYKISQKAVHWEFSLSTRKSGQRAVGQT